MFFFNDTATAEIYTLSLHDALPILLYAIQHPSVKDTFMSKKDTSARRKLILTSSFAATTAFTILAATLMLSIPVSNTDRKSTRLNSSHANISYAVFCLKKKKEITTT